MPEGDGPPSIPPIFHLSWSIGPRGGTSESGQTAVPASDVTSNRRQPRSDSGVPCHRNGSGPQNSSPLALSEHTNSSPVEYTTRAVIHIAVVGVATTHRSTGATAGTSRGGGSVHNSNGALIRWVSRARERHTHDSTVRSGASVASPAIAAVGPRTGRPNLRQVRIHVCDGAYPVSVCEIPWCSADTTVAALYVRPSVQSRP